MAPQSGYLQGDAICRRRASVMKQFPDPPAEASAAAAPRQWPSVELPVPLAPRPDITHVLFDFDGTLSLIRQGWPEVMVPMFVEALPRLTGETAHAPRHGVRAG